MSTTATLRTVPDDESSFYGLTTEVSLNGVVIGYTVKHRCLGYYETFVLTRGGGYRELSSNAKRRDAIRTLVDYAAEGTRGTQ